MGRASEDIAPSNLNSHTFEEVTMARGQKWADEKMSALHKRERAQAVQILQLKRDLETAKTQARSEAAAAESLRAKLRHLGHDMSAAAPGAALPGLPQLTPRGGGSREADSIADGSLNLPPSSSRRPSVCRDTPLPPGADVSCADDHTADASGDGPSATLAADTSHGQRSGGTARGVRSAGKRTVSGAALAAGVAAVAAADELSAAEEQCKELRASLKAKEEELVQVAG